MKKVLTLLALVLLTGQTVLAQDVRTELAADYSASESKLAAMAGALNADQLAWRPGEGVRSSAEVLNHVAGANYFLPTMIGCAVPEAADAPHSFGDMQAYDTVTDVAVIQSRIAGSFEHLRSCAAGLSDEKLANGMEWFGMSGSGQAFMYFLAGHTSEHVGQLIAYLRVNGVVPPWSS